MANMVVQKDHLPFGKCESNKVKHNTPWNVITAVVKVWYRLATKKAALTPILNRRHFVGLPRRTTPVVFAGFYIYIYICVYQHSFYCTHCKGFSYVAMLVS